MFKPDNQNFALIAVALSGLIWGILWIPLRALHDAGIDGLWSVVIFYAFPMLILTPLYFLRLPNLIKGGIALHVPILLAALGLTLYAAALLYTQVINAMLLYYLTPLWSTLLARYLLGDKIFLDRWISMILAFAGVLIIFKIDSGLPLPDNIGDWMGLASGIVWALAAVYMKKGGKQNTIDATLCYFLWGSVFAFLLTQLPIGEGQILPSLATLYDVLPWLVPVVILLIIPPAMGILWGATILSPGILAIVFMTEISTGAISAAIWADEPFGLHEILGIILISLAGLWEPLRHWKRQNKAI
ncbi:DMT family transporter [Marinomonas transparens]|uniref:DMT family transporter n=1 Tax=Marinomonas transparens TaxID=2795388 RepID=A0A934N223_9GAMM|nr:DMT family transporter [Marinomonas transparens]MBJ7537338.1 DMT family transporter [Marinomonas transparens]